MRLAKTWWQELLLFVTVQLAIVYGVIYRENCYVAELYKLQKMELLRDQLLQEYNTAYEELQKNKNLISLKQHAEQVLHLQALPLTSFRDLYDNDTA